MEGSSVDLDVAEGPGQAEPVFRLCQQHQDPHLPAIATGLGLYWHLERGWRLTEVPTMPGPTSARIARRKDSASATNVQASLGRAHGAGALHQAHRFSDLAFDDFEGTRYQRMGHIKKLLADKVLDFATGRGR
jgi:hypothetical protein